MRNYSESPVVSNHNKVGFIGLLITLGIVFGDIGTSPLYVMKAILHTGETGATDKPCGEGVRTLTQNCC